MSDPHDFQNKFAGRASDIADRWRDRLGEAEAAPEPAASPPPPAAAPTTAAAPSASAAAPAPVFTAAIMEEAVAAAEASSPAPPPAERALLPTLTEASVLQLEERAHGAEFYAAVVGLFEPERMAEICHITDPQEQRLFLTRLASVCNEAVEGNTVRWFLKSDRRRARLKDLMGAQATFGGQALSAAQAIHETERLTSPRAAFDVALREALQGKSPSRWANLREGADDKRMRFAAQQFVDPRRDFNVIASPLRTELVRDERRAGNSRLPFLRRGRDRDTDLKTLRDFVTGPGRRQGDAEVMLLQGGTANDRSDLLRRLVRDLAPRTDTPLVVLSLDRPLLATDHGLRRDIAIQAPVLAPQLLGPTAMLTTVPKGVKRLVLVCDRADQMAQPENGEAPFVGLQKTICEVFGPRLRVIMAGTPSQALKHAICPDPHILDLDATA